MRTLFSIVVWSIAVTSTAWAILSLPFSRQDALEWPDPIHITEWWFYDDEVSIHGLTDHKWIDYALPVWTPMYAPIDGYVMASYRNQTLKDAEGNYTFYTDESGATWSINYGLGNWVQLWMPKHNIYLQFAHLDDVSDEIPRYDPVRVERWKFWNSQHHNLTSTEKEALLDWTSQLRVPIKKWDYIWTIWTTWLEHRKPITTPWVDTMKAFQNLLRPYPSRDEPHLHFSIYRRDADWNKTESYDPYLIQKTADAYPTYILTGQSVLAPYNVQTKRTFWSLGEDGMPVFVRE